MLRFGTCPLISYNATKEMNSGAETEQDYDPSDSTQTISKAY